MRPLEVTSFGSAKNLTNDPVPVLLPKASQSLYLDASQEGWGASHSTGAIPGLYKGALECGRTVTLTPYQFS